MVLLGIVAKTYAQVGLNHRVMHMENVTVEFAEMAHAPAIQSITAKNASSHATATMEHATNLTMERAHVRPTTTTGRVRSSASATTVTATTVLMVLVNARAHLRTG